MAGIDFCRSEHGGIVCERGICVNQAGYYRILFHKLFAEHDFGHIYSVLRPFRMGNRSHERLVAVLDMAVDHIEMALVDRQIHRFANGAAGMVQAGTHISQFDKITEVLNGGVAPALVEVVDKRRTVSRGQHGAPAANDHVALRVAGILGEFSRRRCLDYRPAHAFGETHPLTLYVRACVTQQPQRLRVITEVDADLFENQVGICFDQGKTCFIQEFVIWDPALDKGRFLYLGPLTGGFFGASASAAPAPGLIVHGNGNR